MNIPPETSLEPAPQPRSHTVRFFGVGGAGAKFIELLSLGGADPDTLVVLTADEPRLYEVEARHKVLLQSRLLRGLGTGGDPDIGRATAEEHADRLKSLCIDVDVAIIVTGLGGGTGGGAAPLLARLARESGALVLVFAVLPFACEGRRKSIQAQAGLEELQASADAVLSLHNQKLFRFLDPNTSVRDAFRLANDHLLGGVLAVQRLLTRRGLLDLKFSTVCAAMRGRRAESAYVTVEARGTDRVKDAVTRVLGHAMLDEGRLLAGADTLLVSVVGGPDLGMAELNRLVEQFQSHCGETEIILGADVDESFGDRLTVTVIATQRRTASPEVEASEAEATVEMQPTARSFDSGMGTTFLDTAAPAHSSSRLVPPPPELTQDQRWEMLEGQGGGQGRRRRKGPRLKQGQLPLEIVSKGRFEKTEPNLHNGEDLDVPTYLRRGVALN
jgi:cell division protein FtsZ